MNPTDPRKPPPPPTRLNVRDVLADDVHRAMLAHADEIRDLDDVLRLATLRDITARRIEVAVHDLVAQGRVAIRAIDHEGSRNVAGGWLAAGSVLLADEEAA